jgi:nicotinate-nucleotide pyrophosphorylase (carboxylating)
MYTNTTIQLINMAFAEDLGPGDITSDNLIGPEVQGVGCIVAKEPMTVAGLDIAQRVFETLDADIIWHPQVQDGDQVREGHSVVTVNGRLRTLLKGERTALNFLQRLSGIATQTRTYVTALGETKAKLVDTRKTTPGWRMLEKYAVRMGGAFNHRTGLYDGVLIKDNHIAVCGGIEEAVRRVRRQISHLVKIEVEVSDMNEVKSALSAGADVIMLDNMDIFQIREAVTYIDHQAVVEVSGNVTLDTLPALADTGVDIISSGALTHSARSMDLSMRISPEPH